MRYVGLSINKGKGGGGKVQVDPFTRATGITTDSNNNVTDITLGDTEYTDVLYDGGGVGVVTGFTETKGGVSQIWNVEYDSEYLVTRVKKFVQPSYSVSAPNNAYDEGVTITFTVTTTGIDDGTQFWWMPTNVNDWVSNSGSITISNNTATFNATLSADGTAEGTETFQMRLYADSSVTQLVHTSPQVITVNDTSNQNVVGQQLFTSSTTWTCPAGVTSVCVVCIGMGGNGSYDHPYIPGHSGGGLGWKNNISVTPGNTYSVVVATSNSDPSYFISAGTVAGYSGASGNGLGGSGIVQGGSYVGDGGGNGGTAGCSGGGAAGGGGAGGYSGNGGYGRAGNGGNNEGIGGSGGGGAGGGNGTVGGGVGPYGQGANGTYAGGAGSGGSGKQYGGGGMQNTSGGGGCVRIIWGIGRAFPSTLTSDQ